MQNRKRMLMGATALLYLGPLMAGLGGYGWAIVPVFLALFLLWLFILRPQQWPKYIDDWRKSESWIMLGANSAIQLLLVTLLFGIGRGIGGALGVKLPLGEMLPIGITFLAIPLGRMIWDPWKVNELNEFLDHAVHHVGPSDTPLDQEALDRARHMITPLAELPDDSDLAKISEHLVALSAHADQTFIRTALMERVGSRKASLAETKALILYCTDPVLIALLPGDGPTLALTLLPDEPEDIALFARRLAAALDQDAKLWDKCPSTDHLADLVAQFDNTEAEAPLRDLIDATNRAQPANGLT